MNHTGMTRAQLLEEVAALRQSVAELKAAQGDQRWEGDEPRRKGESWSQLGRDQLLIARIGQIISSTLEIDDVYQRFAHEVSKMVHFDRMSINTIDRACSTFTIRYLAGRAVAGRHVGVVRNFAGTQTEYVMAAGRTLIRDYSVDSKEFYTDADFMGAGLCSSMIVPLVSKGQVIGVLSLRSELAGGYGDREKAILEQLAQHIAPAIENSELYRRTREAEQALRQSQEAEHRLTMENALLAETGRIISSTLNIDDVYERFAQQTKQQIDFDRMSINVINRDEGTFTFKYVSGLVQPGRPVPDVVPMSGTQTEYVMQTGQTLVRSDVALDPRFRGDRNLLESGMRSSLMVPLKSKGEVFGTWSLRSLRVGAYGGEAKALVERLADQIASAIENSELYAQTRKAEEEMRESERRFRYLVESASDAFFVFDLGGRLIDVNARSCKMLGYSKEELLQLTVWDLRADQTEPSWSQVWDRLIPGSPITVERLYRRKDGTSFPVENCIGLVELKGEPCLFSITRDTTERKQTQEMLLNQARNLAVADERNRLARELHDSVTQSIYSLTLFSETARQLVRAGDQERSEYYLTRLGQTSQQALKEMRLLVHELRPLQLEDEGLVGAIQYRLDAVERRAGINGQLLTEGILGMPSRYEIELYWVVQEALNNSLKHASATEVTVRLTSDGQVFRMEIQDNGTGFDYKISSHGGGMGLVNMRHRVQSLGGELSIVSEPSVGTTVAVTVIAEDVIAEDVIAEEK